MYKNKHGNYEEGRLLEEEFLKQFRGGRNRVCSLIPIRLSFT
jgi:hypothetical protein